MADPEFGPKNIDQITNDFFEEQVSEDQGLVNEAGIDDKTKNERQAKLDTDKAIAQKAAENKFSEEIIIGTEKFTAIGQVEKSLEELKNKIAQDPSLEGALRALITDREEMIKYMKNPPQILPTPPTKSNSPGAGDPTPANVEVAEANENGEEENFEEKMREQGLKDAEEKIIDKYEKGAELPQELKNVLNNIIDFETEDIYKKFTLNWIKNNKDDLKLEGISFDGLDDKARFELIWKNKTMRQRALQDMENDIQYEISLKARDRSLDLQKDLQKDQLPLETHYLLINNLDKLIESLKNEMTSLPEGDKTKDTLKVYIDKVADAQKQLVERLMASKTLEEKVKEELMAENDGAIKIAATMSKEEAIKFAMDTAFEERVKAYPSRMKGELNKKYDELIEKSGLSKAQIEELKTSGSLYVSVWPKNFKMSKEDVATALTMGLDVTKIRKKGWLPGISKKILINGKVFAENDDDFNKKLAEGWGEYIREVVKDEITKDTGAAYDLAKEKYEQKKKEIIQREIDGFAKFSKNAEGGVAGVYERIKNRLVAEFLEKIATKEMGPEKIKKAKASGKRVDLVNIIGKIYNRTDGLDKLTGDEPDEEMEIISKFFGKCGVKMSARALKKSFKKEEYKKAVGKKKGFVDYLLNILAA